jgi:hypothetical protein
MPYKTEYRSKKKNKKGEYPPVKVPQWKPVMSRHLLFIIQIRTTHISASTEVLHQLTNITETTHITHLNVKPDEHSSHEKSQVFSPF